MKNEVATLIFAIEARVEQIFQLLSKISDDDPRAAHLDVMLISLMNELEKQVTLFKKL